MNDPSRPVKPLNSQPSKQSCEPINRPEPQSMDREDVASRGAPLRKLLHTLPEVAWMLGSVSTRTVVRMVKRGELTAVRVRRRIMIPAEAIDAWLVRQCTASRAENMGSRDDAHSSGQ